ncbi:MAG: SLC13 family permease [Thermoanaerobaculia bacterium]|nr:SLC13 family permease [Thermoanaerobaculia bacterium]
MTPEILSLLVVLVLAVLLFATEVVSVDVAGVAVLLGLWALGLIPPAEIARGFGNDVVIFLGSLFVVTEGLVRTGALDQLERRLATFAERRPGLLLVPVVMGAGMVSAVLSNTATVAAFLPLATGLAQRLSLAPSKILMPLAFASILGGTVTLIGTSTNIVVSGALPSFGLEPMSFFELSPVGIPIFLLGVVYLFTWGRRLLPDRQTEAIDNYGVREYLGEVRIPASSPWCGKNLNEIHAGRDLDVSVLGLVGDDEEILPLPPDRALQAGDVLMIKSSQEGFLRLTRASQVELVGGEGHGAGSVQVHEILLAPQSHLSGRSLREHQFRSRYNVTVLAISHRGWTRRQRLGDRPLQDGDAILVQGDLSRLQWLLKAGDVILLDQLQFQPQSRRSWVAAGIFLAMILIGAFELMPFSLVALAAAGAMVLTRSVSSSEAYSAVDWRILIMVGCLLSLAKAMETTGAAAFLAEQIAGFAAGRDPLFLVAGFYLLTVILTQPMSNQAAALVVLPVAVRTAMAMDLNPRTLAVTVCLAASSSFITPLEPACLMVYGPGRYRFLDYLKVGAPLTVGVFLLTLWLVPWLWPL